MINMYLACLIAVLSLYCFSFSVSLGKINRTMVNLPKEIFESSVPMNGPGKLYFDKKVLEAKVDSYIKDSISGFADSYTLSFYYYWSGDGLICKSSYCDGVEVTLKAPVTFFEYKRTMFYEIRDRTGG